MKRADLDLLIEKYYAGETSQEEEQELKLLLQSGSLSKEHMELKEQFQLMEIMGQAQLPDDFDARFMETIQASEKSTKHISRTYWLSGVAATIVILIAIWFGTDLFQPKAVYGTITDPELAFNETKKVLDEVSKKMNKAITPVKTTVDKVEDNVKQAGEIKQLNKALNNAKKIDKMDEASDLLKSMNKVYIRIGNS